MNKTQLPIIFGFIFILTACDAIRVVRLTNKSTNTIELRTDCPQTTVFLKDSSGNYKEHIVFLKDVKTIKVKYTDVNIDSSSNGLIIKLKPFQSFDIAGHIGSPFIKIQPFDLNFSKLTVYTITDTIEAKNKQEIIRLLDDPRTKYIKRLDKKDIGFSNKFYRHIIVRK